MQWKLGGELNDPQMMCVGSLAGAVMEGLPDIVESAVTLQPGGGRAGHFRQISSLRGFRLKILCRAVRGIMHGKR